MKRFLSLILVAALTLSLALALGACGKNKETDNTTAADSAVSGEAADVAISEEESVSKVVHTTNEHYEEDYEELTLPPAISTTKANETTTAKSDTSTTTKKTESKVTTTKQSLVTTTAPTTKPTTTKPTTTKKGDEPTSLIEIDTNLFSQTEIFTTIANNIQDEYVGFGGVNEITEVPRPNVTYYDKFVTDVLASGNYTMTMQTTQEGTTVSFTLFRDGEKTAYKGETNYNGIAMSFRFFQDGDTGYIVLPFIKSYFRQETAEGFSDGFNDALDDVNDIISMNNLQYCGVRSGTGYVCEMYKDTENNIGYNYYFSSEGLTKIEAVDMASGEKNTQTCALKAGVEDNGVFKKPSGYKEVNAEELEQALSGMVS
ncbi:MAG: hypothetical protein IJB86_02335 [Clostridia bacterium]|nr:hypothetical protein [Clostridia bacterium]